MQMPRNMFFPSKLPQATQPQATQPQATQPQATQPQATQPQGTVAPFATPPPPATVLDSVLDAADLAALLADETVVQQKAAIITQQSPGGGGGVHVYTKFTVAVSPTILAKVNAAFGLHLAGPELPFKWIRGNTPLHVDRPTTIKAAPTAPTAADGQTYLLYVLAPPQNRLLVGQQLFLLQSGTGYIFDQNLLHGTLSATLPTAPIDDQLKLTIGPLNSLGEPVGAATALATLTVSGGATLTPAFVANTTTSVTTSLLTNVASVVVTATPLNPATQYIKYNSVRSLQLTVDLPVGEEQLTVVFVQVFSVADDLPVTGIPCVVTIRSTRSAPAPSVRNYFQRSLFTDNSMVFYQPHSFPASGAGSGVRNCRAVARRT